jgi:hypothetical protein
LFIMILFIPAFVVVLILSNITHVWSRLHTLSNVIFVEVCMWFLVLSSYSVCFSAKMKPIQKNHELPLHLQSYFSQCVYPYKLHNPCATIDVRPSYKLNFLGFLVDTSPNSCRNKASFWIIAIVISLDNMFPLPLWSFE